jgi:hypothetical protein
MNNEYDSNTPTRKHALDLTITEWVVVLWRAFCAQTVLGLWVALLVALVYAMAQEGQNSGDNLVYVFGALFAVAATAGIVWLFTADSSK